MSVMTGAADWVILAIAIAAVAGALAYEHFFDKGPQDHPDDDDHRRHLNG